MKKLIQGLRRFKSEYFCKHQELFEQLSQGQQPRVLFVTCSDSRIDPELITQAQPGEIFVIRNAGNIIPPYGAANGGEGASIEYAVQALGIRQIVVCGHSHCGAMKGLLKHESLREEMPLVYDWLKHAEATKRLVKEHYGDRTGEDLLDITIAENVLTQIENLRTYPAVYSKLYSGALKIYAWIFDIDDGEVMAYDAQRHAYVLPQSMLSPEEQDPELDISPACAVPVFSNGNGSASSQKPEPTVSVAPINPLQPFDHLSSAQLDRIYRGSSS